ncbi:MAG: redox-regulated ATPase YchF [Planctomycetota bacterium]|jgi:GTP-binding protein YchF
MSLSIGIVGLPNVGKSTIFNALTRQQSAESANYPFCTIEPNKAVVPVPDERVSKLADIVKPEKAVHATVDFYDIAGLVKGASKGEGLGNQFLGNIRQTSAILHVVRCFDDPDITHVDGSIDPVRDVEIIELELVMADLQSLEKRIESLEKKGRADKTVQPMIALCGDLKTHFEAGSPASTFVEKDSSLGQGLYGELDFLTDKTVIYCANVDEDGLTEDNNYVKALQDFASQKGGEVLKICAKMEEEFGALEEEEIAEYLDSYGVKESGLDQVITRGYEVLGLISYFTAGPKEAKAWTIEQGWKAPKSASVIHTDFEKGFIRAEVISYDDYMKNDGEAGAKAAGVMRVEGKDYIVRDGDVMHFRFNV